MKRNILVIAALWLFAIGAQGQIMPVEMKRAGMMWYYSDYRDARLARSIKVVGSINGDDVRQLREMSGGKFGKELNEETLGGALEELDLSQATIVSGGGAFRFLGLYPSSYLSSIRPEYSMVYTRDNAIDQGMFSECTQLRRIVLPTSLAEISQDAFSGCTQLQTVACPAEEPPVAKFTTGDVREYDLIVPLGSKDKYASAEGWQNFRSINESDFSEHAAEFTTQGLTYRITGDETAELVGYDVTDELLTVPEKAEHDGRFYTVVGIGSSPKEKLNSYVKTVSLPSTIRYIGTNAFMGFHALTTINFPDQLETIGAGAFELAMKLTEVRLPGTVKVIGSQAFNDCYNIRSLELPGVEVVGRCAFNGLVAETIELPATLREIGGFAFNSGKPLTIICHVAEPIVLIGKKGRTLEQEGHEFNETLYKKTHLYVPDESLKLYREAEEWKEMKIHPLSEYVPSSVQGIPSAAEGEEDGHPAAIYSPDGQQRTAVQSGLNIIRSKGTTRKVVRK